jgi:hypothetical protein
MAVFMLLLLLLQLTPLPVLLLLLGKVPQRPLHALVQLTPGGCTLAHIRVAVEL